MLQDPFIYKFHLSFSAKILSKNQFGSVKRSWAKFVNCRQCDQIGPLLKCLCTNFSYKFIPNVKILLGLVLWKTFLLRKVFYKNWATFCFNIWSHWRRQCCQSWEKIWSFLCQIWRENDRCKEKARSLKFNVHFIFNHTTKLFVVCRHHFYCKGFNT